MAEFVEPIKASWRGMEVYQRPPNGSAPACAPAARILGGFETAEQGPMSASATTAISRRPGRVYRDRDAFLADPSQVDVP